MRVFILWFIVSPFFITMNVYGDDNQQFRVGIIDNKPMSYIDDKGKPAGIFVDVLEHAARIEGWSLEYVFDTWPNLRARTLRAEIDILLTMAYSEERAQKYAFNKIAVFNNWAEIFVPAGSSIHSLLDLRKKHVASLAQGIYTTGPGGIISINEKFGLQIELVNVPSYIEAIKAVQDGRADAAVVNRLVGSLYARKHGLDSSGIVFSPVKIYFAFKKDNPGAPSIIEKIDQHLKDLKKNEGSIYYRSINRAMGQDNIPPVMPGWVPWSIGILLFLLLFIVGVSFFLRWQVNKKTLDLRRINFQLKTDMKKRIQVEFELRDSQERFQALATSSSDLIWEYDENGIFTYLSPRIKDLLGYKPDEIIGKSVFDIIPEKNKNKVAEKFKAFRDAPFPFADLENIIQHKDGGLVTLESSGVPIFDEAGKYRGYRGIDRDISRRKKIEAQLQQTQKLEAIGTLAGGIAHDFNNMLSPILGYSEILSTRFSSDSSEYESLQEIRKAANRAKDLVRQILTISRQTEHELIPVKIDLVVKEALKLLRATIPQNIEIRQNIQDAAVVRADPTQIHQIVMNLCTNAFHAMREDGGVLSVSLSLVDTARQNQNPGLPNLGPGSHLQLEISDTGQGIDPTNLKRIFEPYYTTKRKEEGTGLGLAVVHGIVKSHKGHIAVTSESAKGTIFKVYLPCMKTPITPDKETMPVQRLRRGNEHILLVDDEEAIVQMEKSMLESLGYHVTKTTSSSELLDIFTTRPDDFDLVITDMAMPHMNGSDLARKLLAIRPDIPIILCSGFSENMNKEKARSFGLKSFLMKPVTVEELSQTIRRVLESNE
jgi:PAS domain S-box-containing protein